MSIVKEKDKLFDLNKDKLEKILNNISKRLLLELGQELELLQRSNGRILSNAININTTLKMTDRFEDIIVRAGMNDLLSEYISTTQTIYQELKKNIIQKEGVEVLLNVNSNNYLKALLEADLTKIKGLSTASLEKIRDIFLESSIYELEEKALKSRIMNSIEKNLVNYTKTYMNTSRGIFIQKSIDENQKEIENNGDADNYVFEYVGAEDNKVRDICRKGLNKRFFTRAEKEEFESKYGIRYNCRHIFALRTLEYAEENNYEQYKNKSF